MKHCCKGHKPEVRHNPYMEIYAIRCPNCYTESRWMDSMPEAQKSWNEVLKKGLQAA